ncbi:MAG: 5-formyltetrahydrofolate cyclo-ligase [Rubrivivax sp.]|nr:MAG: 5-formyltetrahydrofolate cyclo-ligase [Rubrivivax sp.]
MSTPSPLNPADRGALRRQLLAKRLAWAEGPQAASAQTALQKQLLDVLRQLEPECLGLFWPIQGEFNPRPVALAAQKEWPCQLALPWSEKASKLMHYRPWHGKDLSTVDECGIPSPEGRPCVPDVVLVPCLGFTPDGWRLGYGGGYFDRFLAAHPDVTAIGVAWSHAQLEPGVLVPQAHDAPLIGVVTELQVHSA